MKNRCGYCGKILSLTNEIDGVCYMCAIEKLQYVDPPLTDLKTPDDHLGEGLIRPVTFPTIDFEFEKGLQEARTSNNIITLSDLTLLQVGQTFEADENIWTIIEIDEVMEGVILSDRKNFQLNICHSDKTVYPYNKKGKGVKYLFSFDEIQMINIVIMKLRTHLIMKDLEKTDTNKY